MVDCLSSPPGSARLPSKDAAPAERVEARKAALAGWGITSEVCKCSTKGWQLRGMHAAL